MNESGHIAVYDIEWPNGSVETDVPAVLLEAVEVTEHENEAMHTSHGIAGHRLDSKIDERKYKKKGKKKKAKISKRNKHKLYPYFYGISHDSHDNYYEPGLEGGFSSGFDAGGSD